MKAVFALLTIVAAASAGVLAPASYLTRAPAFDSAVIKSDRLGGNFAYSVAESHAYAQHTPIVQHVQTPVAVSYNAAPIAYNAAPVAYNTGYSAYNGYAAPLGYSGYNGYAAPVAYSGYAAQGYPGVYGYGK